MMTHYEELVKELKAHCDKHSVEGANWTVISVEDGRYVYVTPVKSMVDLDKNPKENFAEKMGEEELAKLLDKMDECYDSHSDTVLHYMSNLSHLPEGYTTVGKNHREYHFLCDVINHSKERNAAMSAIQAESKNELESKHE
ncbi:hypothetical protein OAF78_02660 [Winogradskyella sp.]|nr:hypothetical protein [Winogradskyella sp.]MDB4752643.1 hypothetical protein [Winogradskyella sp.]